MDNERIPIILRNAFGDPICQGDIIFHDGRNFLPVIDVTAEQNREIYLSPILRILKSAFEGSIYIGKKGNVVLSDQMVNKMIKILENYIKHGHSK